MPGIRLQFPALDALDDVRQRGIGAAGEADFFALVHDITVDEFDLGAPAFLHVLAHRGTLAGGGMLAVREALRAIENYVNILQIFPEGFFGFTEVVLAIALILILVFRPTGIMGSREFIWPLRRRKVRPAEHELSAG